jgi:hypothetical protein
LFCIETWATARRSGHWNGADSTSVGALHGVILPAVDLIPEAKCSSIQFVMIGVRIARDECFPQAPAGFHGEAAAIAGYWLYREQNSCDSRRNHLLDNDRDGKISVGDSHTGPIAYDLLGPQRSPAVSKRISDGVKTPHVQQCFLYAGKARIAQIFGRR